MKLWKCFHVKGAKLDKWSFFFVCSASVRQVGLQAVSVMSKVFFSGDENVTCSILSESGLWNDVGWSAVMHEKHIQDDLFHSYVLINTICRENKYLTSVKEEICRKCSVWFGSGCFHVISILSTDTVFYTKCIVLTFFTFSQTTAVMGLHL